MTEELPPPREPEIEFLARAARAGLRGVRVVLWLAGVVGIAAGSYLLLRPDAASPVDVDANLAFGDSPAHDFVWFCPGILFVLPVDWTFGRGRWPLLVVSALLWFGPLVFPDDHRFGVVLRVFASGVAVASLLVWRTLWRLSDAATAAPGPATS